LISTHALPRPPSSPLLPTRRSSDLHQLHVLHLVIVGDAEAEVRHGAAGVVEHVAVAQHELRGIVVETGEEVLQPGARRLRARLRERKSTCLNSSRGAMSYAVVCLSN